MSSVSQSCNQSVGQQASESIDQSTNSPNLGLSSVLGVFSPKMDGVDLTKMRKAENIKKKKERGLRR